jgi:hypothetical protein
MNEMVLFADGRFFRLNIRCGVSASKNKGNNDIFKNIKKPLIFKCGIVALENKGIWGIGNYVPFRPALRPNLSGLGTNYPPCCQLVHQGLVRIGREIAEAKKHLFLGVGAGNRSDSVRQFHFKSLCLQRL